jgi:nucleoside-diphosphate kinase
MPNIEHSLVIIKPDGVQRKLIGEIISRFERRNLVISNIKMIKISKEIAEQHYFEHRGKPFFDSLIDFTISGYVVIMIVTGINVVAVVRQIVGTTSNAAPGTIRGDFAETHPVMHNVVHASDSIESARREIELFFEGYFF